MLLAACVLLGLLGCAASAAVPPPPADPIPPPPLARPTGPRFITVRLVDRRPGVASPDAPAHHGVVCCRVAARCAGEATRRPVDVISARERCSMTGPDPHHPAVWASGAEITVPWPAHCPDADHVSLFVDALPEQATQCHPIANAQAEVFPVGARRSLETSLELSCE